MALSHSALGDNTRTWHDRASHVIAAIQESGGLTATEISTRCEVPRSSTYWLLDRLCRDGNLRRESGRYVFRQQIAPEPEFDAIDTMPAAVIQILKASALEGFSLFLGQIRAGGIVIAARAQGERSPYIEDLEVGLHEAAHATALGQSLLDTVPKRDLKRHLRATAGSWMRRYTDRTILDPDHLIDRLCEARITGVHTEVGQYRPQVACAAVVVKNGPRLTDRVAVASVLPTRDVPNYGYDVKSRLNLTAAQLQPWLLKPRALVSASVA